jgi:hypothetical protein
VTLNTILDCVALSHHDKCTLRTGSYGVPSPPLMLASTNMEAKVPTFEPQDIIKIWLIVIQVEPRLLYTKVFAGLVLRVGSSFLLNPTLDTHLKLHLQKVLPCRYPCHIWDPGLGTMCEVISPNFHALNN